MATEKRDVLLIGARKPVLVGGLEGKVNLHDYLGAKDKDALVKDVGAKIGAIALVHSALKIDGPFLSQFPNLKQVSSFGVGYDQIDAKWAGVLKAMRRNYSAAQLRDAGKTKADSRR